MASFSQILGESRDSIIRIKSFYIQQSQVLGQGAFGIVFKGTDAKKNTIAAKRIDAKKHSRVLDQDLERLKLLDHPNVMKILDVETIINEDKNEHIIWMMMPFCAGGDLNTFYSRVNIWNAINCEVMIQIMEGINYLHSQDIVHRDIKPGNILVAAENHLQVQLTDFDISKCLDPEVETSLMTSNVGTLAFKAPEFFQRTSPGKLEYHRNVDIYAAGLTFLAILQAEKRKSLIPRIETPLHDSEYHAPSIGQLIAERIKYKVEELSIVRIDGDKISLKRLISEMTHVNPKERLTASAVLRKLNKVQLFCLFLTNIIHNMSV